MGWPQEALGEEEEAFCEGRSALRRSDHTVCHVQVDPWRSCCPDVPVVVDLDGSRAQAEDVLPVDANSRGVHQVCSPHRLVPVPLPLHVGPSAEQDHLHVSDQVAVPHFGGGCLLLLVDDEHGHVHPGQVVQGKNGSHHVAHGMVAEEVAGDVSDAETRGERWAPRRISPARDIFVLLLLSASDLQRLHHPHRPHLLQAEVEAPEVEGRLGTCPADLPSLTLEVPLVALEEELLGLELKNARDGFFVFLPPPPLAPHHPHRDHANKRRIDKLHKSQASGLTFARCCPRLFAQKTSLTSLQQRIIVAEPLSNLQESELLHDDESPI
eukprot:750180-Hanusia_phi.AAC.8